MASLSPRNTYSVAGYESNLADFIAQYEDKKSQIYLDTKNLPTIGIGYLLTQNNWQNDFANSGIDLSQNQIDNFANLLTNIASATARNDKQRYINEYNAKPEAIKLTNDDMQNLFNTIIDRYKNIVKNKVGQAVYDKLDNSDEMIALVSLAYNSGGSLIGNNLVKAIKDGDRVAAWYEIRYGSNAERSDGLQNRRTKESDMFGLYDGSSISDNEAKHVIRFLESKRTHIESYLKACNPNSQSSYNLNDLDEELRPAINLLVSKYGGREINVNDILNRNGKIIIGQGIGQIPEKHADGATGINDSLNGTNGNDLIFAERGNDIVNAGGGNDVIYGGDSSDTLNGGLGYDIYHADNQDTIYDSDGKGRVYLNNSQLRGGKFNENLSSGNIEIYKSNDGSITYEYNTVSKDLKVNGLVINDFDNEELEINLTKELVNEFAILSDTTGSMDGAINSVKAQAIDIVNSAFARDKNTKIGVFGYNDPDVQTFTNLTNNQGAVISAINSLYANDGGDTPEMTYHGIYNVANSNWSEYSVKRIFIFGDAPAKDTYFKETALAALKPNNSQSGIKTRSAFSSNSNDNSLSNIQVFAIQTGGGDDVAKEFREIANFSGGAYINLTTSGYESVADILFDMMNLGTNKSETIIGNNKNNTLNGKGGNDILQGNLGSDTYKFDDNFGKDTIIETNPNNNDKNIIKFTNNTKLSDLTFTQTNNDLIINHKNYQNSITIKDFYTNENKISYLEFADGSKLNNTDLKDLAYLQEYKSILHYANSNEPNLNENLKSTFFMADIDTPSNISGAMLNDSLIGSDKNDSIWGGYGNDIIIGKKGDDTLNGGKGNDKFIYTKFDGNDTILDNGGSDTLVLKGISKDEANFTQSNNDLIISFNFNNDKITIKDHFKGLLKPNKLENIIFDKDEKLTISQIDEFITNKWNKITYNDLSDKFGTNVIESVGESLNKIANDLAFRFGKETAINSNEFANSNKDANNLNSPFITQNQIDKIIEQVSTYSDNKGLGNFAFNDLANSQNLQIYGV